MTTDIQIPDVVSTPQAATILGLTEARIRQLAKEGYIQRAGHGRVNLISAVQGYVKSVQDSHERALSKAPEKNRLLEARAREVELRNAGREGLIMNTEEHFAVIDELVGMVKAEVDSLPARLTRDLARRKEIQKETNALLTRLSEQAAKKAKEAAPKAARGRDARHG